MGLLEYISQKAKAIPDNAKAAYRGLLAAPEELAALFSPEMRQRVNQAMNTPATLDRDKMVGMAMDYLQTTPAGLLGHIVYHGSPHKFNKFDMSKIGTGEGAQAYGHGLYFAESPGVAKSYAENLSDDLERFFVDGKEALSRQKKGPMFDVSDPKTAAIFYAGTDGEKEAIKYFKTQGAWGQKAIAELKSLNGQSITREAPGNLYKVDIPDEIIHRMLDWDKPLSEQSPEVQAALEKLGFTSPWEVVSDTGHALPRPYKSQQEALLDAQKMGGSIQQRAGTHKGSSIYSGLLNDEVTGASLSPSQISEKLNNSGIPGIRYLDGTSRNAGQGTSNFVLFDDTMPRILEVNGQPTGLLSYADEAAQKPKPKKAK